MPIAILKPDIVRTLLTIVMCCTTFGLFAGNAAGIQDNLGNMPYTIVIDPGHGGRHPGTIWQGGKYKEKDMVLDVALKLGASLKRRFPGIHLVYTRTTDKYVDLAERSAMANRCKANLFLSIHVNAAKSTSVHGTETFVMGTSRNDANFELVKAENSVITVEDDYKVKYEGFDPSSPESYIIFSLIQNTHLESSLSLAETIEKKYLQSSPIKSSRGVKQGGLLVLWQCTMPAVLTEIGFLSNRDDRKLLITPSGRTRIADALLDAVSDYVMADVSEATAAQLKTEPAAAAITSVEVAVKPSSVTVKRAKEESSEEAVSARSESEGSRTGGEYFSVQILSASKELKSGSPELKREKGVFTVRSGGLYKHLVGRYNSREQASQACTRIRKKFSGAFVVRINNGKIAGNK